MALRVVCASVLSLAPLLLLDPATGRATVERDHPRACASDLANARIALYRLEQAGHAYVLRYLEGRKAAAWIDALNALPPRTAFDGDTVVAVVTTRSGGVEFGIFRSGCQVVRGLLTPQIYREIEDIVATPGGTSV